MNKKFSVGILSGMGPLAGGFFCQRFNELLRSKYPDLKNRPEVIDVRDANTPDRSACIKEGETGAKRLVDYLSPTMDRFKRQNCSFVLAPCNTLMHFKKDLEAYGPRILNIIEETVRYTLEKNPGIETVGLLSTTATAQHGLYRKAFERHGIKVVTLDDAGLKTANEVIYSIKEAPVPESDYVPFELPVQTKSKLITKISPCIASLEQQGAQAIILGCTEFPLLLEGETKEKTPFISSIAALAQAGIHQLEIEEQASRKSTLLAEIVASVALANFSKASGVIR